MTISTTTNSVQYTGNGVTTVFSVPFVFYDASDLIVTYTVIATGVDTVKTITTDYTVSGGSGSTGSVTALSAPASTIRVTIERSIPYTQETDFLEGAAVLAETVEESFDRGVVLSQQLLDGIDRSLKFPATLASSFTGLLPAPEDGKILTWDGVTGQIGNSDIADLSTTIDTVFTGLADGDFFTYNGSNWVNEPLLSPILTGTPARGDVPYINASGNMTLSGSGAAGDIFYRDANKDLARLAVGTNGNILALASGIPAWVSGTLVGFQVLTSASGTYTPTTGATHGIAVAIGGGGGGGGADGTTSQGGSGCGGGGGGCAVARFAVSGTVSYTVGAGGTAGTAAGGTGGSGGTTTLTGIAVATGGTGGTGSGSTGSARGYNQGVSSGIGTTGALLLSGQDGGGAAWYYSGGEYKAGNGGAAPLGGGGGYGAIMTVTGTGNVAIAGADGNNYGGGGGGAAVHTDTAGAAGGAGAQGVIYVLEFR